MVDITNKMVDVHRRATVIMTLELMSATQLLATVCRRWCVTFLLVKNKLFVILVKCS